MNKERPVILVYDAVSPLGEDQESAWQRALRGESGIGPLTRFPLRENFPVRIAGQVETIDEATFSFLNPRDMTHWTSPIFRHALLVVHRALKKSRVEVTRDIAPRIAITFSSAIGGLDALLSADRLFVVEQFSLGGIGSVRGFDSSTYDGDSGYTVSAELQTSPFFPEKTLFGRRIGDTIKLAFFGDHGGGFRNDPEPGESRDEYLSSLGAGLRLYVGNSFSARLDWAVPKQDDKFDAKKAETYVSAAVSF